MALRTSSNLDAFSVFPVSQFGGGAGGGNNASYDGYFPVFQANTSGAPSMFTGGGFGSPTDYSRLPKSNFNAFTSLMDMGQGMYGNMPSSWIAPPEGRQGWGSSGGGALVKPEYANYFPTAAANDPYNPAYQKYFDFSQDTPIEWGAIPGTMRSDAEVGYKQWLPTPDWGGWQQYGGYENWVRANPQFADKAPVPVSGVNGAQGLAAYSGGAQNLPDMWKDINSRTPNPYTQSWFFGNGGGAANPYARTTQGGGAGGVGSSFRSPGAGGGAWLPQLSPYGQTSPQAARGEVDQFLANQANQMKYLESFAQGKGGTYAGIADNPDVAFFRNLVQNGQPLDATEAWKNMVLAQERNIAKGRDDIGSLFSSLGSGVSTGYGNAITDYQTQTVRDQNALLGQMQLAAMEADRNRQFQGGSFLAGLMPQILQGDANRQFQAASQLGNYAFQGPSQLSQQDLAQFMQANQLAFQGSALQSQLENSNYQQQLQNAFNASMYGAQGADQAAQQLLQNSMYAGNQLLQNSMFGANNLFNAENNAALQLFGSQNNMLPQLLGLQLQGQGQGIQAALGLGGLLNANLNTGMQLGGQQYNIGQDAITRQYQEFIRTSPFYHPYMQYLSQAAMFQPSMYFPQYTQSPFSQIAGLIGAFAPYIMGAFGVGKP